MTVTAIESSRLILRDIHLTDWPAFHQMLSDHEVIRFLEYGPFDEFQTREWLSHVIVTRYDSPRLVHHFAIELTSQPAPSPSLNGKEGQTVIGWIALATIAPSTSEWGLSFALARPFWGQGYATEAVHATVEYAFSELHAHRLFAEVDPDNSASAHVVEKCGFELEGRLREKQHIRGQWRDVLHYGILDCKGPSLDYSRTAKSPLAGETQRG